MAAPSPTAKAFEAGDVCAALTEAFAACEDGFLNNTESASGACALVACAVRLTRLHADDAHAATPAGTRASSPTSLSDSSYSARVRKLESTKVVGRDIVEVWL